MQPTTSGDDNGQVKRAGWLVAGMWLSHKSPSSLAGQWGRAPCSKLWGWALKSLKKVSTFFLQALLAWGALLLPKKQEEASCQQKEWEEEGKKLLALRCHLFFSPLLLIAPTT